MSNERVHDTGISVAKAFCIILMVVGHSETFPWLRRFIYLFHMPAFFFISGLLFKEKYFDQAGLFVKRKLKGLWWPYFKWSLVFILLSGLFARLHLIETAASWREWGLKVVYAFTMLKTEQLLGGYWFLKELLYASLLSFGSMLLMRKLEVWNNHRVRSLLVLILLCLSAAFLLSVSPVGIPTFKSRTFMATAFFLTGYLYQKLQKGWLQSTCLDVCSLCLVGVVACFYSATIEVESLQVFLYYPLALAGTLDVVILSRKMSGSIARAMDYIGKQTLVILTFHMLAFKLVSLVKIWHYSLPIEALAQFPVIKAHNTYYWVAYSVVGVCLPLFFTGSGRALQRLKKEYLPNKR